MRKGGCVENVTEEGLVGPLLLARSAIDRSGALRNDPERLKRAWADATTRVLVIDNGHTLVRRAGEGVELVLLPPAETPPGERYLLGVDSEGITYFAVAAPLPAVGGRERRDDGSLAHAPVLPPCRRRAGWLAGSAGRAPHGRLHPRHRRQVDAAHVAA